MADPLNKMIHTATQLSKHATAMSKTTSPVFNKHTLDLADLIRDRLLKGIEGGYDVNGKMFKHHSKFTSKIRKRRTLGLDTRKKQFGEQESDIEAAYESAAKYENKSSSSSGKYSPMTYGGYSFSEKAGGTKLFDGQGTGETHGNIVKSIGDQLKEESDSLVVLPGKTSVSIKADSLKRYQKLQNNGFTIGKSKFATKYNIVGKKVPARKWLGIPMTYRENHPGWKKAMGILYEELIGEYGRIIRGKKADLSWYKKTPGGNAKWKALKKNAK